MKHAGIHWPENANGEHPNVETILGMPGINRGCTLICSPSARFWYRQARGAAPLVVWRAIPRQEALPAQLNWIGKRIADECLNLWDEQPHGGIEHFTPLNELQFVREAGEEFRSYAETASKLSNVRIALRQRFQERGHTVRLMFPAWVPMDDMDRLAEWEDEARQWDTIGLHCYGSAETMRARYQSYRDAFPNHGIFVGEWNSNHEEHDERASLQMWAEIADTDPLFLGATYYIWETRNQGEGNLSIWGNPDRLALFMNPPTVAEEPKEPEEPVMPAFDPWEHFALAQIVSATDCPQNAVAEHWPRLVEQLHHCGINDRAVQVAMAATVAIETASTFAPVREAFWLSEEWRRANLRYYPYYGRGFIQNTWEDAYRELGPKIAALWNTSPDQSDFDLIRNPDNLLNPDFSASAAAIFFRDKAGGAIPVAARANDWREVRRLVQGADAGLDRLTQIVAALGGKVPEPTTERMYGADVPDGVIRQQNSWSCAVRSTYAALWAMREQGHGPAVSYGDGGSNDVYDWLVPAYDGPGSGLLDHTGSGLASALRAHGYAAQSAYPVTLDQVRERAGAQPVLLGGDAWNHWVMVRGRTNDGGLILENPMPGHAGIDDYLRDSFGRLGPMAMVWIELAPVKPAQTPAEQIAGLVGAVAYLADDVAPMEPREARVAEAQRVRVEFVGPRPAA